QEDRVGRERESGDAIGRDDGSAHLRRRIPGITHLQGEASRAGGNLYDGSRSGASGSEVPVEGRGISLSRRSVGVTARQNPQDSSGVSGDPDLRNGDADPG